MTAECLRYTSGSDTYGGLKRHCQSSYTNPSPPIARWLKGISDIRPVACPGEQIMSVPSDGPSDHNVRQLRRLPLPVAASHSEQWFTRLNQQGAGASLNPLFDDEPPFFLPRPSPDTGNSQALQTDHVSSHPAQTSQQAPLSHSLLSQLELSEHDPNTYRDIIDDLTVQNKKLKRQLKRYEKDCSVSLKHDGLFEVRVRHLPPGKRRELETMLQKFLSTIPSLGNNSESRSDESQAHGPFQRQNPQNARKPTQSPSPNNQGLDSAYASATGATIKTLSGVDDRSSAGLLKQVHPNPGADRRSYPYRILQKNSNHDVTNDAKHIVVVQRLESLFLGGEVDASLSIAQNLQNGSSRSEIPGGRATRVNGEPLIVQAGEHTPPVSETTNSVDFGQGNKTEASERSPNATMLPQERCANLDVLKSLPTLASTDRLHCLRHLDAASPTAASSPGSDPQWLYLNLLVNVAELHTLNVTLEFVRQAIHDVSTRLELSEDGRKVRWHEHSPADQEVGSETKDITLPVGPIQASPTSHSMQADDPSQVPEDQKRQLPSVQPFAARVQATPTSRTPPLQADDLGYRPMFLHSKRSLKRNDQQEDEDSSYESDSFSSGSEEASQISHGSDRKNKGRNGPMVFLNHDPFFLDLSADLPEHGSVGHPSYTRFRTEPIGSPTKAETAPRTHEKRREWNAVAQSSPLLSASERGRDQSPSLLEVFGADGPDSNHLGSSNHLHIEASGLGGIQLDDNFIIDVATEQAVAPSPPTSSPPSTALPLRMQVPSSLTHILPSSRPRPEIQYHSKILTARTTHLPPSPLPPPSYIYPTIASEEDSSSDDDEDALGGLDDLEEGSEDLEYMPVFIASPARVEVGQPAAPPLSGTSQSDDESDDSGDDTMDE
ncbi:MAG: hypothetical protein Q9218_003318 [Villophora microphyllina]